MSITYPEATPATSKKLVGAAVMNSGSALFPNGSTGVYDRASKARGGRNMMLAWIAAPVALVLVGGAVYLSANHNPAAKPAITRVSTTTTTAAPVALASPALTSATSAHEVSAPAPIAAQTTHMTHAQTTARAAIPVAHSKPITRVSRSSTVTTSAPADAATPAPVQAVAAPTPGTFTFTPTPAPTVNPSASQVTSTPQTVVPAPVAAAPITTPDAQPAPQS